MVKPFPPKTHIGNHMLHPEALMLNSGYDPPKTDRTSSITSPVGTSLPGGMSVIPPEADAYPEAVDVRKVPKHKVAALQPAAREQEPRGR
jgi:hypothetical protein